MSPPTGTDDDRSDLFGGASGPSIPDRPRFGGVSERERRRRVVELVESSNHPQTIGDLARDLTEWLDEQSDAPAPTEEEVHDVLFSFDLPTLDEAGRLWFDVNSGIVSARRPPQAPGEAPPRAGRPETSPGTSRESAAGESSGSWETPPGTTVAVAVGGLVAVAGLLGVGPLEPVHAVLAAGAVTAYVLVTALFADA